MVQGKPVECLIRRAAKGPADLIVLGSPRPKGQVGLRSRMLDEKLFRSLRVPVIIAPHPHD
jgi:nucleotide-binding universal stress UspA family protein